MSLDRSVSGTNSRPRTPPSAGHTRDSTPATRTSSNISPPIRSGYTSFLNQSNHDWRAEEYDEEIGEFSLEDDEDEFGLPSIASQRRKDRRKLPNKGKDPGGSSDKAGPNPTPWQVIDSGDIAEERGIPN